MKLLVLNGSPRTNKSNTNTILNHFCDGFKQNIANEVNYVYLLHTDAEDLVSKIDKSDIILLAFPLYVLSMPGFVKEIIEILPEDIGRGKKFLGFIQSGFPESYQFQYIEEYLRLLSDRLQFEYMGTILKGYGASVEMMPQFFNNSLYKKMTVLGKIFGKSYILDKKIISQFKRPYQFSTGQALFYKFLRTTGALDAYTEEMIKENNVTYEQSLERPLEIGN